MASWERRQRSAMNSLGAVEPIPARGGGGVLKKTLDRADAIIEALRYLLHFLHLLRHRCALRSGSEAPILIRRQAHPINPQPALALLFLPADTCVLRHARSYPLLRPLHQPSTHGVP